ncbi:MAG TPA: ATP-dependent RecD-like DNA helicase [Gammaproteobacteria bacterium]|nr:ATP-dependent RecD-like DNA helicase [Gammaproteobacteria bacterium]
MSEVALDGVKGHIERVTFHNPDNGFCVLKAQVKGQKDLVTVVGTLATVNPGEPFEAQGTWDHHRLFGMQFKAQSIKTIVPTTLEGIEKYLASGLIKGVGPGWAKKLAEAFGEAIFEVIENEPNRLLTLPGMGEKRKQGIMESWADQKAIRDIMVFLQSHGVSTARAVRIYKCYGASAIEKVRVNPYRLAQDIRGIGFQTADKLAESLGIEKTSLVRARAGLSYTLLQALNNGHCALGTDNLIENAQVLLDIPEDILKEALVCELNAKQLVQDFIQNESFIFLKFLYDQEREIAIRLIALNQGRPIWHNLDVLKAIGEVENAIKIELAPEQREAIEAVVQAKVLIVTGGPGVGKTALVNAILKILSFDKDLKILLAAPTGRAAKRLAESTGQEAKTIHRLLKTDHATGKFKHNQMDPLACDLLIVDETSMVDVPLMCALLRALPEHAALILVGDIDQLPSVGPGQVLSDCILSGALSVVRLTKVFRQAQKSRIIVNAHYVNNGRMPELSVPSEGLTDFYFVPAETPEEILEKLIKVVHERIPQKFKLDPIQDVQVLSPMNRGGLGARAINIALQEKLNPPKTQNPNEGIQRFGWSYRLGDKIIQTSNDYDKEVFNGDVGVITKIDKEEQQLIIDYDMREVPYDFNELDQIQLAYALSIHKSQGSKYPAVVIPIATQHYMMLKRNLLYTGITRGRKLVILIGQKKAIGIAVHTADTSTRHTKLKQWLIEQAN